MAFAVADDGSKLPYVPAWTHQKDVKSNLRLSPAADAQSLTMEVSTGTCSLAFEARPGGELRGMAAAAR